MPVPCSFAYEGSNCEEPATHYYRRGSTSRTALCDIHAFDWEPITEVQYRASMIPCDYHPEYGNYDRPTCGNEASSFYFDGARYMARCWGHVIREVGSLEQGLQRITEPQYRFATLHEVMPIAALVPEAPPGPSVWARLLAPEL